LIPLQAQGDLGSVKVALTDFDGTLVVLFDDQLRDDLRHALLKYYLVGRPYLEDLRADPNPYSIWTKAYRRIRLVSAAEASEVNRPAHDILATYELRAAQSAHLLPGVAEALVWLQNLRILVAVVSSNSRRAIETGLAVNGVAELVDQVVGREADTSMDSIKPDPTMLHRALNVKGRRFHPGEAFFIGDSRTDMLVGRQLGMLTIGVLTGGLPREELRNAGADEVFESFASLPKMLPKLVQRG
jgi:phosphoglycolate phosphatase-like HAD superfamily hydrolase